MRKWIILIVLTVLTAGATAQAESVYFLVAEIGTPCHNDSYLLRIDDPWNIAHARDLIEYGPGIGKTIVGGTIYRWWEGPININRNYTEPTMPAWSWSMEFGLFWDLAEEICDGWPGWVEDEPCAWPSGSETCFWGYTVVAELGTDLEPWFCNLDVDTDVDLGDFAMFADHWMESGCGHRYWCGGADLDGSGSVDTYDLAILAKNWLWSN